MNSEIKFRHPIFRDGKFIGWHYWGYVDDGFSTPLTNAEAYGVESYQFTGFKDKNKKEVFGGDIVKRFEENFEDKNNPLIEFLQVSFDSFSWMLVNDKEEIAYFLHESLYDDIEVVGNIYENPELIK